MIQTNPLHHNFFVGEVEKIKQESGLRFGDTTVFSLASKDIDAGLATLFRFGIPSKEHVVRIAAYPTEHPDRLKLDQDIRGVLFGEDAGRGLTSVRREEGLAVSINCGLGGTDPYLAILFNNQCYRVTRDTSELSRLNPPRGYFSFLRNSSQERQLLSTLPSLTDLIPLDGAPDDELQGSLPKFCSTLQRIIREECGELREQRIVNLYLPRPSKPELNLLIPDRTLVRFSIDNDLMLVGLSIVGNEAMFFKPLTLRALNRLRSR